jgi:hypothetical protein
VSSARGTEQVLQGGGGPAAWLVGDKPAVPTHAAAVPVITAFRGLHEKSLCTSHRRAVVR